MVYDDYDPTVNFVVSLNKSNNPQLSWKIADSFRRVADHANLEFNPSSCILNFRTNRSKTEELESLADKCGCKVMRIPLASVK